MHGAVADGGDYPSCQRAACRMILGRRAEMGEPNFRHYLAMQAGVRRYIAAHGAALTAREHAESGENGAAWDALQARLHADAEPAPLRLVLPTGPRRSARPLEERRERYRLHLVRIIEDARAMAPGFAPGDPDGDMETSGGAGMAGRLCGFCGGGCCTMGGEHAYLSADTIRGYVDRRPGLSNEDVLSAYLGRVAARTRIGSCINQTGAGCSLPREMRSDICNRFACEPLARLEAAARGPLPVQTVLIVRRKQDHWQRANPHLDNAVNACAVLRETGLRRVPLVALSGSPDNDV
jgi:hypothetical protein